MLASFSLPNLSKSRRTQLLRYAVRLMNAQQEMTKENGENIVHYTLRGEERHISKNHYPKPDRIDNNTGAQYFYHCHPSTEDEPEEHGHFHCFMRYKAIPVFIKPAPLADWDKNMKNPMTHLVALAVDCYGHPTRLFTVNRWVSSEIWYEAKSLPRLLKRFQMTLKDDPYWMILDQWIESVLHLFSPQIAWLHHQRDQAIAAHKSKYPELNPYEDENIEFLSEISINLEHQVQWLVNET